MNFLKTLIVLVICDLIFSDNYCHIHDHYTVNKLL